MYVYIYMYVCMYVYIYIYIYIYDLHGGEHRALEALHAGTHLVRVAPLLLELLSGGEGVGVGIGSACVSYVVVCWCASHRYMTCHWAVWCYGMYGVALCYITSWHKRQCHLTLGHMVHVLLKILTQECVTDAPCSQPWGVTIV